MGISYITTVFNEEGTIEEHLNSLLNQSFLPKEVIIVDGASKDKTVEKINTFISKFKKRKVKFKLIIKKGNRSVCRNEAIKKTAGNIIACSDSGCRLDKNWLKNITKSFTSPSSQVVAGYYKGEPKTIFQKCLVPYVLVMPDKLNEKKFLPATRSIAFRKNVWKKIGGFDERLSHNEDYVFAKKIKEKKIPISFARNAIVYWKPRKNLKSAFVMFFRFAFGDAEAGIWRPKVLFIFLRYLLFFSLVSVSSLFNSKTILIFCYVLLGAYPVWAISKNYRYIKSIHALYILPSLQLTSDLAVIIGTILGIIKSLNLLRLIKNNKTTFAVILSYLILEILSIQWGIPNNNHPFNYHMDEWAQAQSIRALFRHGTSNINGASQGVIFQYLLGGIYLVPFILLHIVNPFVIKNSLEQIDMQHRLFVILRLETILMGVGAVVTITLIAKKFLKASPKLTVFLFTTTPIFILLSNFFKYDISVVFLVCLSIFFIFRYSQNPTGVNFLISAIPCSLSLSTKLTALPLIAMYILSYLIFSKNPKKQLSSLLFGLILFIVVFLIFGIPDIFIKGESYIKWLHLNLIQDPGLVTNLNIKSPILLLVKEHAALFGKSMYILFAIGILIVSITSLKNLFLRKFSLIDKREIFILLSFFIFVLTFVPLGINAGGNRVLILLPFLTFLTSVSISKIYKLPGKNLKQIFVITIAILLTYQAAETLAWYSVRVGPELREVSSHWVLRNVPTKTKIGLFGEPIFQDPPNIFLKEYYTKVYFPNKKTIYKYQIIDSKTEKLPDFIVVENLDFEAVYLKKSEKKDLLERLKKENFKLIAKFEPYYHFLKYFEDKESITLTGILASPTDISIFKRM